MSKLKFNNDRAALELLGEMMAAKKDLAEIHAEICEKLDELEAQLYRDEVPDKGFVARWEAAGRHRNSEQRKLESRIPILEELLEAWSRGENILLYRLAMG